MPTDKRHDFTITLSHKGGEVIGEYKVTEEAFSEEEYIEGKFDYGSILPPELAIESLTHDLKVTKPKVSHGYDCDHCDFSTDLPDKLHSHIEDEHPEDEETEDA